MGKKIATAERISHDFTSTNDADLDQQIRAFQAAYRDEHGAPLAMDARRSLGPGKDRVTFRVRDDAPDPERKKR